MCSIFQRAIGFRCSMFSYFFTGLLNGVVGFDCMCLARWNEHLLKIARDEEECEIHRQRASRLARWRELVDEASKAQQVKVVLPDSLEILGECFRMTSPRSNNDQ